MTLATQDYELVDVDKLTLHPENPRRGDVDVIADSIAANGFYGALVAQRSTGYVLAGNHRLLAAQRHGIDRLPVIFLDVDDETARRILLVDNRANDVAGYDDDALLSLLQSVAAVDAELVGTGYSADELAALVESLDDAQPIDSDYSRKIDPPHYHITGAKPKTSELVDMSKVAELQAAIDAAELPDDVRAFLTAAAQRHAVFNYAAIAEFYAHADPKLQQLMERSALVIVDFDDAIRQGYVRLNATLTRLLASDLGEDEGDAA